MMDIRLEIITSMLLLCLMLSTAEAKPAAASSQRVRPTIGAIRWDAWFDDKINPYEKNLEDVKWRNRLPFFAKVSGKEVHVHGDTQEAVDREIAYAKAGGIDYWAFLYYPATIRDDGFNHDYMNRAHRLYLSSKHKKDVNFCLAFSPEGHVDRNNPDREINEWLRMLKEPSYQRVAGGRPLMYVMVWGTDVEKMFGSASKGREYMDRLRERIKATGEKDPYFVVLTMSPQVGAAALDTMKLDAIGAYTSFGGTNYQGLRAAHEANWDAMKATGKKVVPNLSCGWGGPRDGLGDTKQPTPAELASHVRSAFSWIDANKEAAEARTMLIYAWNEVDEGGWLVPDKGHGTKKLDAIRGVVDKERKREERLSR